MITFLNLALDFIRWQALIWSGWTSTSIVSNSFRTFPSKSLSVTDYGTPDISKHSQLEYCSFAQHWRSKNFILSHSVVFTCFVIMTSDFSFLWYFLNSCHVTYAFQSESTLYSCLDAKQLLARSRREIWKLRDYNWTPTQNHLVLKRTLNHLAKLVKWLSCVLSTYLYGAFDCMFLSFHVRISGWIHTL